MHSLNETSNMTTGMRFKEKETKLQVRMGNSQSFPHYHTLRYDFKPASIANDKSASIEYGPNGQVTVKAPNVGGSTNTVFKGQRRPHVKECLLIVDNETGEMVLQKLTDNITVKATRSNGVGGGSAGSGASTATAGGGGASGLSSTNGNTSGTGATNASLTSNGSTTSHHHNQHANQPQLSSAAQSATTNHHQVPTTPPQVTHPATISSVDGPQLSEDSDSSDSSSSSSSASSSSSGNSSPNDEGFTF